MSSIESYDGLCGIIHRHANTDCQVRCSYEIGHHGKHSWEKLQLAMNFRSRLPGTASAWFEKYCK